LVPGRAPIVVLGVVTPGVVVGFLVGCGTLNIHHNRKAVDKIPIKMMKKSNILNGRNMMNFITLHTIDTTRLRTPTTKSIAIYT